MSFLVEELFCFHFYLWFGGHTKSTFIQTNPLFGILCTPGLLNQVVSYFAATLYISQSFIFTSLCWDYFCNNHFFVSRKCKLLKVR